MDYSIKETSIIRAAFLNDNKFPDLLLLKVNESIEKLYEEILNG